jgi:hypothetical protein
MRYRRKEVIEADFWNPHNTDMTLVRDGEGAGKGDIVAVKVNNPDDRWLIKRDEFLANYEADPG